MLLRAVVDRVWQPSVGSRVRVGVVDRGIGHCVKRGDAGGSCEAIASAAIVAMVDRNLKPETEGTRDKYRLELVQASFQLLSPEPRKTATATR